MINFHSLKGKGFEPDPEHRTGTERAETMNRSTWRVIMDVVVIGAIALIMIYFAFLRQ